MSAGQLLQITRDVIGLLESGKILLSDGSWDKTKLDTISENVAFVVAVKSILQKHGIVVPEQVNRVLQLISIAAQFIK